jgi:gamma-glutamylcyclotransferase (GGCT)/AIG2-like uncharacterized protein YtfP
MSAEDKETERLFSYGTLQREEVQLATFGRRLEGRPDALVGYGLTTFRVEDPDFVAASGTADHRNVRFTGAASDSVEGTVFELTMKELGQADAYEPAGYKRVLARLRSGVDAWVYVSDSK